MKLISGIILVAFCILASRSATAQITISAENIAGAGSTIETQGSETSIPVNIGGNGANQQWSISFPEVYQGSYSFIDASAMPQADSFPSATFCSADTEDFDGIDHYYSLSQNEYRELGYVMNRHDPIITIYGPGKLLMPLPLSYSVQSWTSVSRTSLDLFGIVIEDVDSSVYEIDAWGTMVTAFGTFEVLRIHQYIYTRMYLNDELSYTGEAEQYEWVDQSGLAVVSIYRSGIDSTFTSGQVVIKVLSNPNETASPPVVVTNIQLAQNYPDPFNSSTQILYYLPQLASVKLRVFDILGREVATLVNGEMQSLGQHVANWNGLNNAGIGVATGTYIYRIEAGEFRDSKKMVLVK